MFCYVIVLWVALGLEAGDLDTAKMSLSSSMLGHYCGWILPFLMAGTAQSRHPPLHNGSDGGGGNNNISLGVRVALAGAQVLLWTALGALFYLRERRGKGGRGERYDGNHASSGNGGGDGDGGINIDGAERRDGEPGVEI